MKNSLCIRLSNSTKMCMLIFCRNTSAPSPLNLITSWLVYFIHQCQQKTKVKKPPTLAGMMGMAGISGRMSPRSKMGQKWLAKVKKGANLEPKKSITTHSHIHLSPLGSQLSFAGTQRIETVVDWELVRKKYLSLFNNEPESNVERDNKDIEENETIALTPGANPPVWGEQPIFFPYTNIIIKLIYIFTSTN